MRGAEKEIAYMMKIEWLSDAGGSGAGGERPVASDAGRRRRWPRRSVAATQVATPVAVNAGGSDAGGDAGGSDAGGCCCICATTDGCRGSAPSGRQ